MVEFSANEDAWLDSYLEAWNIATENGYSDLDELSGAADDEETENEE